MSDPFFPELAREPEEGTASQARSRGFVIRTDGAARGNPGPASLGAALFDLGRPDARDDRAVPDASISEYLGVQTNNVAEYTGVVRALELARELGAREVHLLLDSKLIVEQLAGRWRVKDAKLIPLWTAARKTLAGFDRWSAAHVPRALNSVADALANEAIDRGPLRVRSRYRSAGTGPVAAPPAFQTPAADRTAVPSVVRRPGDPRSLCDDSHTAPRSSVGTPGRPPDVRAPWRPPQARVGWSGQRGGRMVARHRPGRPDRWREESPSSAAQGGG